MIVQIKEGNTVNIDSRMTEDIQHSLDTAWGLSLFGLRGAGTGYLLIGIVWTVLNFDR